MDGKQDRQAEVSDRSLAERLIPWWPAAWERATGVDWGLAALSLLLSFSLLLSGPAPVRAALPQGNAVKDPEAILRNALPIEAAQLQGLQRLLEDTSDDLRAKRWKPLSTLVARCQSQLTAQRDTILQSFKDADRPKATALLEDLQSQLQEVATAAEARDRDSFLAARRTALSSIGAAEALLVGEFPFAIPSEFDALPRLLGRATLRISTTKGDLTAVVDGYNAPLTAGAFVDLAERKFYDDLPFTRAEDFYVLQSGDPKGDAMGYVDAKTGQERHVPLEIRIVGDAAPLPRGRRCCRSLPPARRSPPAGWRARSAPHRSGVWGADGR